MRLPILTPFLLVLILTLLLSLTPRGAAQPPPPALPALDPSRAPGAGVDLQERSVAVDDLSWLVRGQPDLDALSQRAALLQEKARREAAGDAPGVARVNAVLAGEAFARAARVVRIWLDRRDRRTSLLPRSLAPEGQVWVYEDTGADLFGHLAIGTTLLEPWRQTEILTTLAAERRLGPTLPDDVALPSGARQAQTLAERTFGAAEYAKDGLLPALERLGRDPWLGRLIELTDAILAEASVPTPRGLIPADSTEVNGDVLQVLARLAWATGDARYAEAAERIALAYLGVLPTTRYLPPHRWDFMANEPLERRRFRLSDHGNEVLPGLIEWHLLETLRGAPKASAHREPIRRMLDRLLEKGRNDDGLWFRVVEIPSGRVEQEGLTDNWGYLLQAYLTAAIIEQQAPDGDLARAAEYRRAARQALQALPRYRYYAWQQGEMDGYADAVESALYVLHELRDEDIDEAARWLDEQIAVLYGFQQADGRVGDDYLDGNFVRSTLLYALWQTQGLTLAPWREDVLVGAAPEGSCLVISVSSAEPWEGRLVFDTPRHRLYLRAPIDYPRLNEWPEWFVAEPEHSYTVRDLTTGAAADWAGETLAAGLPLQLDGGVERQLRVCPEG